MKEKTKLRLKTLILALAVISSIPFVVPQFANADVNSLLRGQICEPDSSGVDSGFNVGRCINNIYIFAISIAGFLAVLMFVLAGYQYITGTSESISEAKKIMGSTLLGLVILFGTYIILNTVDPNLTKVPALVAPQVNCEQVSTTTGKTENICADLPDQFPFPLDANGNPTGMDGGKIVNAGTTIQPPASNNNLPAGSKTIQPCTNCIDLLSGLNIIVKRVTDPNRVKQYYLNKDLAQKLVNLNYYFANERAANSGFTPATTLNWRVTEAWPPTVAHASDCHFDGNCADIAIDNRDKYSKDELIQGIKILCTAAKKANLTILNEYYEFTAAEMAGSTGSNCGVPAKTDYSTVGHLHVK
ncbi:MAG: pilin [Candidatus Doudnabacteria bacterium]